jgi:hypothetical protein
MVLDRPVNVSNLLVVAKPANSVYRYETDTGDEEVM